MIYLKKVSCHDYDYLYDILLEREPYVNISHKVIPIYDDHVRFWESNPYKFSAIVMLKRIKEDKEDKIGLIYLSKRNEVGLFIRKKFRNRGYGKEALKLLLNKFGFENKPFLANIAPLNDASKIFFKKAGFKEIQHTFVSEVCRD